MMQLAVTIQSSLFEPVGASRLAPRKLARLDPGPAVRKPRDWLVRAGGARELMAAGPENHFKAGRMTREEVDMLQAATSDMRRINRQIHWYRANMPHPDQITDQDYWPSRDAKLDVPDLLIWGDDDRVFDAAFVGLMIEADEDLEVVRLPGIGHAPQFEATDAVNAALLGHIESAQSAAAPAQ